MDISELAVALLNDFTVEERSIPDHADFPGRNAAVLNAINSGLQEMFGEGSPWIRFDEKGHIIHDPTNITLTVNHDGTAGFVSEGWEGWMAGCSIVIEGDLGDNQIRNHVSASAYAASRDFVGFILTAVTPGADGNEISFERIVVPGSPVVTVTGNTIVLELDAESTFQDAIDEIEASAEAMALVEITGNSGVSAFTFSAIAQTFLFGGYNQIALKVPYGGDDGTKNATVYQDSVTVANSVMEVLDPVRFNGNRLAPTVTANVSIPIQSDQDYGFTGAYRQPPEARGVEDSAATPIAYSVATWSPGDTSQPGTRIRLVPAPSEAGRLEYGAKLAPPVVTDIGSTDSLPIPQQFVQSILYPMARKHLSGCPFFVHSSAAGEIERAYREALRLLERLKPGKNAGRQHRSLY